MVILFWYILCLAEVLPPYMLPSPGDVWEALKVEYKTGRLFNDMVSSMWRITCGFLIAASLAVPLGLWLGHNARMRTAVSPMLNFFRFLSPLAWIPFAIIWFSIGDKPAMFLIFLATFFPLVVTTMGAVANIPSIYFRVARDFNYTGSQLLFKVTFPAILPQLITGLRVSYGIAWVVIVAAEMAGAQDGLGYGILEARNGLKLDTAVCYMIVIGSLGVLVDRLLARLTKLPNVRWGYER
jgi:NitT/TauT family transport system permease protein